MIAEAAAGSLNMGYLVIIILGSLLGIVGVVASAWAVTRSKTSRVLIETLQESNDAFERQNKLLKEEVHSLRRELDVLREQVFGTKAIGDLHQLVVKNHGEVLAAIGKRAHDDS